MTHEEVIDLQFVELMLLTLAVGLLCGVGLAQDNLRLLRQRPDA